MKVFAMGNRRRRGVILFAWLLLLAACGGGGGGGTAAPDITSNVFMPRSASEVSISQDDAGYADRKRGFESSAEYQPSYQLQGQGGGFADSHLRRINAAAAYARGATGAGQTIAITDSGIRDTHREFAGSGKVRKMTVSGYAPTDSQKSHGTAVAALAVGSRDSGDGLNMHGVAFDANVYFREVSLGPGGGAYRPTEVEGRPDADAADRRLAALFDQYIANARAAGAAISNYSFGVNGAISSYRRQVIRNSYSHTAQALAQPNTANADKTIVVWAAGNAGGRNLADGTPAPFDSPELWPGLGVYFPTLTTHVLAVVALDQDGSIAGYSNRCGIAKGFCLAAPGTSVIYASSHGDDKYSVGQGTSFAAPLVSGSLALLRQYFRGQLGNTELVTRLLATANREGIYANSDIYGHGLVDLDAATAPVGTLVTGLPGDPGNRPFVGSGIALSSGAFGASLQSALADIEVAGFDALGAPFFQSAAGMVMQPVRRDTERTALSFTPLYNSERHGLSLAIENDGTITDVRLSSSDGWWVAHGRHSGWSGYEQSLGDSLNGLAERFNEPLTFAAPHLSLVRDGTGIGWSHSSASGRRWGWALLHGAPQFGRHNSGGKRGIGMLLHMSMNRQRLAGAGLSVQAGAVREADGFLGARPQGAFGQTSAATAFAGINGDWMLGKNWHALAAAYLGYTRAQINRGGLLRGATPIVSSAFSIAAARTSVWRDNDWFGLRLSQPLRAESGKVKLRVPAGRTKYGEVVYKNHAVSLTPAGRALHAEAIYRLPVAGGIWTTRVGVASQPQHQGVAAVRSFMRVSFEWQL